MRIIAGRLGGRNFESPHGHRTHPMSEKIRGAIFNALGDIEDLTVLDAFAGTGALALEAISRGAKSGVAIDLDTAAHRIIGENIRSLRVSEQVSAVRASAVSWSRRHQTDKFDIVFLDPPYDNVEPKMLIRIALQHTDTNGIVVISLPPPERFEIPNEQFMKLTNKVYGDAKVSIYRRL